MEPGEGTMTTIQVPSDLLARYREIIEARDALSVQDKQLSDELSEISIKLIKFSEDTGLTSFADGNLSISVQTKMRAKYDPAKWEEIVRWDLETGTGAVQRRLTDAKIEALLIEGVPFPEGLSLEPVTRVLHRRK